MSSRRQRCSALIAIVALVGFGQVATFSRPLDLPRPDAAGSSLRFDLSTGFEPNLGQAPSDVRFQLMTARYRLAMTDSMLEMHALDFGQASSESGAARLRFVGAQAVTPEGASPRPARVSYFLGNDPARWVTGVPTYDQVTYRELYPGTNLVVHRATGQPEYDFVVSPDGRPQDIEVEIEGARQLTIGEDGALTADLGGWALVQPVPIAWQDIDGGRRAVPVEFVLRDANRIGFSLGDYDTSRSLTIDPVLLFSTYFGGGVGSGAGGLGSDRIRGVAVDPWGDIYVAGRTQSNGFPIMGLDQAGGNDNVFVAKFSSDGSTLLYSARIGGSGNDAARDIDVDAAGNAYVVGGLDTSFDFPVVNALQPAHGGGGPGDGFVFKLNSTGTALEFSSYFGGPSFGDVQAVAVDPTGRACMSGAEGVMLPTTPGAFQTVAPGGPSDGYVACLNADGSLRYSTYLGGLGSDEAHDIAVDGSGSAWVVGFTSSVNFPLAGTPFQSTMLNHKAFITRLEVDGSGLVYSTFLGGSAGERGWGIALHPDETVTVTGVTNSLDFPLVGTPFQATRGGGASDLDAFVATLDMNGSNLLASTYLGASDVDLGFSVALDAAGRVYVAGETRSVDFPLFSSLQPHGGATDTFVAKLTADLSTAEYSTLLGGSGDDGGSSNARVHSLAVDATGAVIVVGDTASTDFPTANPWQAALKGNDDGFIAKLVDVINVTIDIKPGSLPNSINLGSNGTVPVAVLSTVAFDASTVDPTTVTLASAPVKLKGKGTPMASLSDVNDDGLLDLVVHVETQAFQLSYGDTLATLEGETFDGMSIRGVDTVRIVQ